MANYVIRKKELIVSGGKDNPLAEGKFKETKIGTRFEKLEDIIMAVNDAKITNGSCLEADCAGCPAAEYYCAANLQFEDCMGMIPSEDIPCLGKHHMRTYIPVPVAGEVCIEGEDMYKIVCLNQHEKNCKSVEFYVDT